MSAATQAKPPMTSEEIALLVNLYREAMEWSQETLAELSGLTVRTIQRVEAGQPSSIDARRCQVAPIGLLDQARIELQLDRCGRGDGFGGGAS